MHQIQCFNDIALRILQDEDLEQTANAILAHVKEDLKAFGAVMYLVNEEIDSLYTYAYTKTTPIESAMDVLRQDPFLYRFPCSSEEMFITRCLHEDKIFTSQKLSDFFSPTIHAGLLHSVQETLGVKSGLCAPILLDKKPVGALFVAFSKEVISQRDVTTVQFYAHLMSIALHNQAQCNELKLKDAEQQALEDKYNDEKVTTSMLSHELKTPIAIAYNNAQLLKRAVKEHRVKLGDLYEVFDHLQNEIDSSVKRLNYISGSIFTLMDSENKKATEIHELKLERQLEQLIGTYKNRAEAKGLDFEYEFDFVKGKFYGGGVQVEQVLTVLLDNALKYTNKGLIRVWVGMDGKQLTAMVADTGLGVPESKRELVFERFYRCSSAHGAKQNRNASEVEGLGLGLYVAKRIVQKLGGSLDVGDNPEGQGAQFQVSVPVYKRRVTRRKEHRSVKTAATAKKTLHSNKAPLNVAAG